MKQIFLFDFGKVLGSETNILAIDKQVAEKTGLSNEELLIIFNNYWNRLKIGEIDLDDYHRAIVGKSQNNITLEEMRNLHKEKIWIDSSVLNLAKDLKKRGHRVMILSNESKQGMEHKKNKFLLPSIFERIYNSAEIGIAKPDKGIFEYVLKDLAIEPDTVTFIDDWDKNVMAAKSVGIRAIQYLNYDQLKEALEL